MDISGVGPKLEMPKQTAEQNAPEQLKQSGNALANEMKDIKKARLQRQVMADPSLAGKLVATEASPTYNAEGSVIQAVSSNLGDV